MPNPAISTEELHNLLKQLFPETEISKRSVDLLAIQIADLEPESAVTHVAVNDHVISKRYIETAQQC